MIIITTKINQYKEKDGIIHAISSNGAIDILAKGIFDTKNKNSSLNNVFLFADVEIETGKYKYPVLKEVYQIKNPLDKNFTLEGLCILSSMNQMFNYFLNNEEQQKIYNFLFDTLKYFRRNNKDFRIPLFYMIKILQISGYSFEIKQCVRCHKKNDIKAFLFTMGGFVCSSCLKEDEKSDLTIEEMIVLRNYSILKDYKEIFNLKVDEQVIKSLLKKLDLYIKNNIDSSATNLYLVL
ncbi:MAG: DNA repair protein RecO [Bacilli bacterium]